MATTWKELKAQLAERYRLRENEPDWLALLFDVGEPQRVRVDLVGAFGAPWLLLRADVCRDTQLSARAALQRNDDQALGTLSLWKGVYHLRHAAPLAGETVETVGATLERLALQAAQLRRELARPLVPERWCGLVALAMP